MGLGDRLKKVAEGVGDIFQAPFGLVFDTAKAWASDEYNPGFGGVFGGATEQAVTGLASIGEALGAKAAGQAVGESSVGVAVKNVFDTAERVYSTEFQRQTGQGILGQEPGALSLQRVLGTASGASGSLIGALHGGDPTEAVNFYRQWQKSEFRTPGQAWVEQAVIPDFYNRTPDQQDLIRETAWYNITSGTIDAGARWFTDPLVIAGKGLKVARNRRTFKPGVTDFKASRPKGHAAALRKLGLKVGDEVQGPDGFRMVTLKPGKTQELYTVVRHSGMDQLEGEGMRVRGLDEAVDERRALYSPDEIEEVRNLASQSGLPEDQLDDFVEQVIRSDASDQINADKATRGILGTKARKGQRGRKYAGSNSRPMQLVNDLTEAKRYASSLYKADPTDMPIILKIDPDGLPVIYEEFNNPVLAASKDLDPNESTFAALAGDVGEKTTSVLRLDPEDLDDALWPDGGAPSYLVDSPGSMNSRLYNPDGSAIEPDLLVNFEELSSDLTEAARLFASSPIEAEKFLAGRQTVRNQSLVGGNHLAERASQHKVVQGVLNWLDNKGRGRSTDEIRRVLFPDTIYGAEVSRWLSEVNTYQDRRTVLMSSMGYRLPELDGLEPMLRAKIDKLLKAGEDIAAGKDPDEIVNAMLGFNNRVKDMAAPYMSEFIDEEIATLTDQASYVRFLDEASQRGVISQLRMPAASRRAANLLRRTSWYQQSPLARPIRVVVEHRPHQWVNLDDEMSDIQVRRQLEEARGVGIKQSEVELFTQRWIEASGDPFSREKIFNQMNETIIERAARTAGMSRKQFEEAINQGRTGIATAKSILKSRRYASSRRDMHRFFDEDLGEISEVAMPLLETQLGNWVPLPNAREIVRQAKKMGTFRLKYGEIPEAMLSSFYRYWKPSVLLRGGWMLRVVSDEQLRILAKMGSLVDHLAAVSLGEQPKLTNLFDKDISGDLFEKAGKRTAAGFATITGTQPLTSVAVRGAKLATAITEKLKLVDPDVLRHMREVGLEDYVSARAGFGGPSEKAIRSLQTLMGRDELRNLNHLRTKGSGQWMSIGPEEPGFHLAWGRVLNEQYGRSGLGRRVIQSALANKAFDVDFIDEAAMQRMVDDGIRYLQGTTEGRAIANAVPWFAQNPERWVENVIEELFDYTGGFKEELLRGALDRKVTLKMMEGIDEAFRPQTVHSEIVAQTLGQSEITRTINSIFSEAFDLLGRLPTDTLSRQPFFKQVYASEMVRLERLRAAQGLPLTEEAIQSMSRQARATGIKEVKTFLYDLAETSQLGHTLRFIAPFYPAWQEVLTVWNKIAIQDPSVIGRARLLWEAPNKAGMTFTDEETGEEWLQFRLSEQAADQLGLTGWTRYVATGGAKFAKNSFNLVLNNPLPGVGPPIQYPVNEVVKNKPELEESLKWLLPHGVTVDSSRIFLSPLARQLQSELSGTRGDASYERAFVDAVTWMDVEYRAGRRSTPPTEAEAHDISRKLQIMRGISRLALPAQPIFMSPMQPYIDVYRDMIETLGPEKADEVFLNEYGPEFFALTVSRTVSKTGIPPTVEAELARRRFEELIEEFPEYGRLIIGDEGVGEFSTAAFAAQLQRPVDPDNPFSELERTYRGVEIDSRTGGIIEVDRRLGWQDYIKFLDLLDLERRRRGLPNLQVKEADDLTALKRSFTDNLAIKYPSWWEDFNTQDKLKWDKRIQAFKAISSDIEDRPDLAGLSQYLELRSLIAQELNRRKVAGGASTLTATANQDLAFLWESLVFKIIEDNVAFGPVYYRYLEGDPVK